MTALIPRPARDIIMGPFQSIDAFSMLQNNKDNQVLNAIVGMFGGGRFTLPPTQKMINGILRVTLVAVGAFALIHTQSSLAVGAVLAGFISLPSLAIAGGSVLLYSGFAPVVTALATGSFTHLSVGLALIAAGYLTLEVHDIIPFGLAETFFVEPTTNACARPLAKLINGL